MPELDPIAVEPITVPVHEHVVVEYAPPGWQRQATNLERHQDAPYRMRGTTTTYDSESFVVAATNQAPKSTYFPIVYADEPQLAVTAVLNQQQVTDDSTVVEGWGDLRVVLQLRRSPEWQAWLDGQGLHDQEAFAEFIESRLDDIHDPAPADLLDLAQTFSAHTSAQFGSAVRLDAGQVQLNYTERIEARAGSGSIDIPQEFTLAIRPFVGAEKCIAKARLRYRVAGGQLKIGYQLVRPDLVERTVFDDECTKIAEALDTSIIRGSIAPVTAAS